MRGGDVLTAIWAIEAVQQSCCWPPILANVQARSSKPAAWWRRLPRQGSTANRGSEGIIQVARKMDDVSEPDQGLEHRRQDENRHGQDQSDPEPFPEIRRHVRMVRRPSVCLLGHVVMR